MSSFIQRMVRIQRIVIFFCALFIAVAFGAVVVLRYVFHANLFAYEEWVLLVAFVLYFIGGAQGSYDDSHIKADLVDAMVQSLKIRRRFALLKFGLESAICAVISYWGAVMVLEALAKYPDLPATPVYGIPLVVPQGMIFIGFVLMTFYASLHFIRVWRGTEIPKSEQEQG